ncbi:hypothetical protein GCM10028858_23580 [Halorubrum pallidum]
MGSIYASVDYRSYPEKSEIITDPVTNTGETVLIFADVLATNEDQNSLYIRLEDDRVVDINSNGMSKSEYRQNITVQINNTSIFGNIEKGSYIQIYGDLRDESTVIDAEVVVVDYQDSSDYNYMYGISLLGAFFAILYFFKHWRINLRVGCFQPRGRNDG